MLTKEEARSLAGRILGYASLKSCQIEIRESEDVFIRFANNGITTSGYRINRSVSITSATDDHRSGTASVSEFSEEALRRGVEQAEMLAKISKPDPEYVPDLPAQQYPVLENFDAATGAARGEAMIGHVRAIIERARKDQLIAAGFVQRTATSVAVANKAGLLGYHQYTDTGLTNTMRNKAGTSSGWATQTSTSFKDLNGEETADISAAKCLRGDSKRRLEPGRYTVILEPAAVSDLIGFLGFSFSARDAEQGQSFLSKKGQEGSTQLSEKLFPEIITLRSDPFNPKLSALPWGPGLIPNEKVPWVEKGVVKNLFYDRFWARKSGRKPTALPMNLVLEGQERSLDDLIKAADKAILVTRFWYIRPLQPQTLQLTGLTRDGLFLVEGGKISAPLMNFRWNESPVHVLQNTKMLGRPVPTQGAEAGPSFAPPLFADDFNFASVSDAV